MKPQRHKAALEPASAWRSVNPLAQRRIRPILRRKSWIIWAVFAVLALGPAGLLPAQEPAPAQPSGPTKDAAKQDKNDLASKSPSAADRRRAAKLFLQGSKLFEKELFEQALADYRQAAKLDPSNPNYALSAELARSHAVTALLQSAVRDRNQSDAAAEREALAKALALDPENSQVIEHLHELADKSALAAPHDLYDQTTSGLGEAVTLAPTAGVHSFHIHADQRQAILQVFKAYGLDATIDDSVRTNFVQLDLDDATFDQTSRVLSLMSNSFFVPVDAHRALVARNTPENRLQFMRQSLETIYLPGLTQTELTDVGNVAKNVFELTSQQAVLEPAAGTITVRAPEKTLTAFNATIRDLIAGHTRPADHIPKSAGPTKLRRSITVYVDDSLGKGLRSLLRQVVADAAGDEAVLILARELIAIRRAGRVDCTVGVAFHGDRGHGDGRKCGQPLFQVVIFPLAVG